MEGICDIRTFAAYLQCDLGVMIRVATIAVTGLPPMRRCAATQLAVCDAFPGSIFVCLHANRRLALLHARLREVREARHCFDCAECLVSPRHPAAKLRGEQLFATRKPAQCAVMLPLAMHDFDVQRNVQPFCGRDYVGCPSMTFDAKQPKRCDERRRPARIGMPTLPPNCLMP